MESERLTMDQLEQRLVADERMITRLRARQLADLKELDRRQAATGDGCRSLSEWVAARLDVNLDTAKGLVRTMRRTESRPDRRDALVAGDVTFDRVEALSRIPEDLGLLLHLDVAGVRREMAKRARISSEDERRSAEDQFLVMQPNLDESWWKMWGGLDGYTGAIVDKTLSEKADRLPDLPDGAKASSAWRRAVALGELCVSDDPPPTHLTVFVDAREATATDGEAGAFLEAGPRVGRRVLEAILCDADTEVIARTENGRYLDYGRRSRTVPPALKRALLDRYRGRCAAEGCDSRHRLQAHHLTPWSQGGRTDQEQLVLLCWFHHQVVVHKRGFQVYKHPDHGRVRFHKPKFRPEWEPSI